MQSGSTTVVLEPTATIVNASRTFIKLSDGSRVIPHQINPKEYLLVSWDPLILATLFTIPWRIVDNTLRETESFYQLQRPGGVTAENSLFLNYATSYFLTAPFKALGLRHYVVLASSLISLAAITLAPLSSETFFVSLSGDCGSNARGRCNATWGIYTSLARAIEVILALITILTVLIITLDIRRDSGVFAGSLSIIGGA
jgi:hypothetical protein